MAEPVKLFQYNTLGAWTLWWEHDDWGAPEIRRFGDWYTGFH